MNYTVIITRSERRSGGQTEELKRVKFEAPSITVAKVRATKIANDLVFLSGKIHLDGEKVDITGKDLHWKSWDVRDPYTQDNGKRIGWSGKLADSFYGNYDTETKSSPYYFAWVTLYWEIPNAA